MQLFNPNAIVFSKKKSFWPWKHEKNPPQKLLIIGPQLFFQYCQPAQNQPKSHFLFHKNPSLLNFYIMTLMRTLAEFFYLVHYIFISLQNRVPKVVADPNDLLRNWRYICKWVNKVLQKLNFSKNVNNKKCAPKMILFNEIFFRKIRIILDIENWLWKSEFCKLLTTRSSSK